MSTRDQLHRDKGRLSTAQHILDTTVVKGGQCMYLGVDSQQYSLESGLHCRVHTKEGVNIIGD